MLKPFVKTLEEIDPADQHLYVKTALGYKLDSRANETEEDDDDEPQDAKSALIAERSRLKEFRKENIRLKKEMDEIRASLKQFEGVDPQAIAQAQKAAEGARNAQEKELMKAGKWDEVFALRDARAAEQHKAEMARVATERDNLKKLSERFRTELHKDRVSARIRAAADAMKIQIDPRGVEDLNARALRRFGNINDDGELVALDGEDPLLNDEGKPYSERDFLAEITQNASHLLVNADGADFDGSGRRGSRRQQGVVDIDPTDPLAFGKNIDAIASGAVQVRSVKR